MKGSIIKLLFAVLVLFLVGWGICYQIWLQDATIAILFSICFYGSIISGTMISKLFFYK